MVAYLTGEKDTSDYIQLPKDDMLIADIVPDPAEGEPAAKRARTDVSTSGGFPALILSPNRCRSLWLFSLKCLTVDLPFPTVWPLGKHCSIVMARAKKEAIVS